VTVAPTRRVTLREAAEILGISKEAVRKRVNRGTLRSEVEVDGRRYVYVDAGGDAGGDEPPTYESDALTSEMQDRIAFLERELDRRADEAGELRRIIAALTSRIPEIEAPREAPSKAPETPETVAEMPVGPEPSEAREEAQEGTQRRSWWRRMFGR
jgi:hypothetical protein